jgi:hypothetical protein
MREGLGAFASCIGFLVKGSFPAGRGIETLDNEARLAILTAALQPNASDDIIISILHGCSSASACPLLMASTPRIVELMLCSLTL